MNPIDKIKEEFWKRVYTCNPGDIISDDIKLVADKDIDWLLTSTLKEIEGRIEGKKEKHKWEIPLSAIGRVAGNTEPETNEERAKINGHNQALDKAKSIINSYIQNNE